jgi:hypothetical protein
VVANEWSQKKKSMVVVCPPPKLLLFSQFTIFRLSALVAIKDLAINTPEEEEGARSPLTGEKAISDGHISRTIFPTLPLSLLISTLFSPLLL